MDRELARKRPANAVTRPIDGQAYPRTITMSRPLHQRADLMKDIRRMSRRGEIGHMYQLRQTVRGWEVQAVQLKPRAGWWRTNGVYFSVALTLLTGALAALVWAVAALVAAIAASLPIVVGFLVVIAVVMALSAVSSGGRVIEVIQKVRIRG